MRSIRGLFKETKHEIDSDHLDRMSRRYRHFDSECFESIPKMCHPKENTQEFDRDFEEVLRCHKHPSLNTKFLHNSDDSVEEVFKKFCKENGFSLIDWEKIKDVIHDVDVIVLKLKYENNRPRPLHYLRDMSSEELQIKYKKSPSFFTALHTLALRPGRGDTPPRRAAPAGSVTPAAPHRRRPAPNVRGIARPPPLSPAPARSAWQLQAVP